MDAVHMAVESAQREIYADSDPAFIAASFGWASDFFGGKYADFQPLDTLYHDVEHTLQGTLCMSRLLLGRHRAGASPPLPLSMFQLGIVAILLHDTGYLKRRGDDQGTGAKYTEVHVQRSAEFAALLLTDKGFSAREIQAVQSMILCTGVRHRPSELPFASVEERLVGFALGTSDLLGQMSADDYIEKLPVLFQEFAEAAKYGAPGNTAFLYRDADDLMERTPAFWHNFVLPKLERDFEGIYRYLNDPYPEGPNCYLENIESNLWRLDHLLATRVKLGCRAG